ncbi:MAG: DegQ family serine endoprotease [Geminicoccaceae bacterium]
MSQIRLLSRSASVGDIFCRLALVLVLIGFTAGAASAQNPPVEGFSELVERVSPAVVNISTAKQVQGREDQQPPIPQFPPGSPFEEFFRDFFDRQQQDQQQRPRRSFSLGSGFVIDPEGYVVTNNHVIAEADEITVVFNDDSEYAATLIGRDPKTDLALLKIERDEPFPHVEWADSDAVNVGDWMLAIGNPFGFGSTVTAGIISARGRDISAGPYDDFIQVDAAINRGNSGGPSFDLEGRVFGVNTAIFSPTGNNVGIGFAIPANLAKPVIEQLRETGRVARGWLGVRIQTVTEEIAEGFGLTEPEGALVASVNPGGPAAEAGIEAGDVILEFDGKKIERMRGLPRIVAETEIGKAVDVLILRKNERKTVKVTLGELPDDETLARLDASASPSPTAQAELEGLGLTVAQLDDELRSNYEIEGDVNGVVIVDVAEDSPGAAENLRPGDMIVEVDQTEVGSPPEVAAKIQQAKSEGKRVVVLLIQRQGDPRFVPLRFAEG